MKRILTAMVSVLAVVALCVCFAGCATDVKGKTYVYDKAELNIEKELTPTEQAAADLAKAVVDEIFEGEEIVFDAESDKVTVGVLPGKYAQEGEKVNITGITGTSELTASGSTLVRAYEKNGFSFKLVYKIKK